MITLNINDNLYESVATDLNLCLLNFDCKYC